jgi:hypothetical protein
MTAESQKSGTRRDHHYLVTAQQIHSHSNRYVWNNRETAGSGVFYAVRAKAT